MKYAFILTFLLLTFSLFAQTPKEVANKLGKNPIFFIDSVMVDRSIMKQYPPDQIAAVSVYIDSVAIELVAALGVDGVVYIETKPFAKNKYWNYFKSKSDDYARITPLPESDSSIQYILNDRVLTTNFEGSLSLINDDVFKEIKVINKTALEKEYRIFDKSYGVIIKSNKPDKLYKANKKF